jgi:hypothetical protein
LRGQGFGSASSIINMFDKILKLILLISPLAYSTGISIVKFEILFFHFSVLLLFLSSLLSNPVRDNLILSKGIVLFLCFCIFNTAIHTFQSFSVGTLINLFLFCIALNLIHKYMGKPREYYKFIGIAVVINISVYLLQRYWFNFLPFTSPHLGGLFGSAPRLGNYLAIVTPIVFSHLWFIIPIIAVMAGSLNPIGIFTIMIVRKIMQRIKPMLFQIYLYVILMFFVILFILVLREKILVSIMFRINSFIIPTITEIFKLPLIGHGLGAYYNNIGNDPYNSIISFTHDVGVLGLALIGYGLWKIRKYFDLSIESLSLIAVILASMIDYSLEIPRLWPTIAFILASFFIKDKEVANVS